MHNTILDKEVKQKIKNIKTADIIIGIPSFNNAKTINHVIKAVQAGLVKYFSNKKAVIVNSDGGSKDGTMEIVKNTTIDDYESIIFHHKLGPITKISFPYHGIPGKGSALRSIFQIAKELNAQACAVVDSDLKSITPEWIELLIKPQLDEGYDFVAPLYQRHKFDGTITNNIIYPLTRTLYGKHIRQPIGGEFGFSGRLAEFYLNQNVWNTDVTRYGIDIWMTTTAVACGYKICQSFLGAKIHDPKDPATNLSTMLYQVVSSAFFCMTLYENIWTKINHSESVPTFGFQYTIASEAINVNINKMIEKFLLGTKDLIHIWKNFLNDKIISSLEEIKSVPLKKFHISDELWTEIIYSFAAAYHKNILNKEHLIRLLTPLYIARTASFIIENYNSNMEEVEAKIEKLCKTFEQKKSLLIKQW